MKKYSLTIFLLLILAALNQSLLSMAPTKQTDLYAVLGVSKNATQEQIKKAYKELALKWNPDKWAKATENEKKQAKEKFKEISNAYDTLKDLQIRKKYNEMQEALDQANKLITQAEAEQSASIAQKLFYQAINLLDDFAPETSAKIIQIFIDVIEKWIAEKDYVNAFTAIEVAEFNRDNLNAKAKNLIEFQQARQDLEALKKKNLKNFFFAFIEKKLSIDVQVLIPKIKKQYNTLDIRDEEGRTPLMYAVRKGDDIIIEILLFYGADINAKDKKGKTALDIAQEKNLTNIVKLLQEKGAKTSAIPPIPITTTPSKPDLKNLSNQLSSLQDEFGKLSGMLGKF